MSDTIIGAFIGCAGVILGVVLTKIAEVIQPRLKNASKPEYAPAIDHELYTNSSLGEDCINPKKSALICIKIPKLISDPNIKNISLYSYKKCKNSLLLEGETPWENIGAGFDIFLDKEKFFAFKIIYYSQGFKYKDYWIGMPINIGRQSYQIALYGPYTGWEYFIKDVLFLLKKEKTFHAPNKL